MQNFGGQIWCIMGNVRVAYSPQTGMDLGGGCRGYAPPLHEMTCGFPMQLVFCKTKHKLRLIGAEVNRETRLKNSCETP